MNDFSYRLSGTTGCEILLNEIVIAWTVNEEWAAMIVALLDNDLRAVGAGECCPERLVAMQGITTETDFESKGKENE